MRPFPLLRSVLPRLMVCAGVLLAMALPARAERPEWAGKHGHGGGRPEAGASGTRVDIRIGAYFGPAQRVAVQQVDVPGWHGGRCPPGLAKQGRCGPGARPYVIGQPLPVGVVYQTLPPQVAIQLGTPPAGHRFVRVAADILLIAVGTGLVVDAMQDLGR